MNNLLSVLYDTIGNITDSVFSKIRGGYLDVSDNKNTAERTRSLSDFLSEKISIKFDVDIKKGAVFLFAIILLLILSFIIAGTFKKTK